MDDRNLKRLCKETGGDVFFPSDTKQTKRAFDLAKDYLRNQYFLVYEPNENRNTKHFREIEVRIPKHRDARVLTRRGYFPGALATEVK
jgi:Ca-activated chloride channel family protein